MITLLCVVASAVLLGVGLATDTTPLSYAALAVALIGVAIWVFAYIRERKTAATESAAQLRETAGADETPESEGTGEPEGAGHSADAVQLEETAERADTAAEGSTHAESESVNDSHGQPVDDDTVIVVPGRKRYHRAGCANLNGHAREELTLDEAKDEGFTACTSCTN